MKKSESFEHFIIEQVLNDEEDLQESSLSARLTDAAKLNNDSKEIASMVRIAIYDNDKALLMTKLNINVTSRKHALQVEVVKKLKEDPYLGTEMCSNDDDEEDQIDPLQLEALLL